MKKNKSVYDQTLDNNENEILLKTIDFQKKNFALQRADKANERRLKTELLIPLITEAAKIIGIERACVAVGIDTSTYYRYLKPKPISAKKVYAPSPESEELRREVLALFQQDRFSGCSPRNIFATLKEEGRFVCSVSTLYRIRRVLESSLQTPTETLDEITSN